jgi:uncharacterized protein
MKSDTIISRLRKNSPALRERGVLHAALFGSRARGDERPDSDTDIMVELDPDMKITVFDYVKLKEMIGELVGGPVDVINRDSLKPHVQPTAMADAIYAF